MTFFKLNGLAIPVDVRRTTTKKITALGELEARWGNRPSRSRRSLENQWSMQTTKISQTLADTVEGLLENYGHQWSFVDDAWSSAGLRPNQGSGWVLSATSGPVATRRHALAVTGSLSYDTKLIDTTTAPDGGRWTVLLWYLNGSTWERRCIRNDGSAFVDGVSDSSAGSILTVSAGAVVFSSSTTIADLVVLPFYVDDSFARADFDWTSGLNLAHRFTFDETFSDDVDDVGSNPVAIADFARGKVGRCVSLNGSTQSVSVDDAFATSLDGNSAATFAAWVNLDALPTAGNRSFVFDCTIGAGADSKFAVHVDDSGFVGVDVAPAVGDSVSMTSTTAIAAGTWHLVVASVDVENDSILVYVNGSLVGSSSAVFAASTWSGGVDASSVFFGQDAAGTLTTFLDGRIDEARLFLRALSSDNAEDVYLVERFGKRYPGPRFSSALPRLSMWGDFNGATEVLDVVGEVTSQDVLQHGASPGETQWTNNAREVSFVVDEVKGAPRVDSFPPALFSWGFSPASYRLPLTSTQVRAASGPLGLTGSGSFTASSKSRRGPFGFPLSSQVLDGTNFLQFSTTLVGTNIKGASALSAAVWFRLSTIGATKYLLDLSIGTPPLSRLAAFLDPSNVLTVGGRSEVADSFRAVNTNHVVTVDRWTLVSFDVDFADQEVRVYVDGELDNTAAAAFNQTAASEETGTPSTVGAQADGTDIVDGAIAFAGIWDRSLTVGEHAKLFELGKQGRFL